MRRFEFKGVVRLDIAGTLYRLRVDAELQAKLLSAARQISDLAKAIQQKEKDEGDATAYCVELVDDILGIGASMRLFEVAGPRLEDITDLMHYIASEIKAQSRAMKKK